MNAVHKRWLIPVVLVLAAVVAGVIFAGRSTAPPTAGVDSSDDSARGPLGASPAAGDGVRDDHAAGPNGGRDAFDEAAAGTDGAGDPGAGDVRPRPGAGSGDPDGDVPAPSNDDARGADAEPRDGWQRADAPDPTAEELEELLAAFGDDDRRRARTLLDLAGAGTTDEALRAEALSRLAWHEEHLDPGEVVSVGLDAAGSDDADVRSAAVHLLGRRAIRDRADALEAVTLAAMWDEDAGARARAAERLPFAASRDAFEAWRHVVLHDEDWLTRAKAIVGLEGERHARVGILSDTDLRASTLDTLETIVRDPTDETSVRAQALRQYVLAADRADLEQVRRLVGSLRLERLRSLGAELLEER